MTTPSDDELIREMCFFAIQADASSLQYIPNHFKTQSLCDIAVSRNPGTLGIVPEQFKNKDMCFSAVLRCVDMIKHVPHVLMTDEMRRMALEKGGIKMLEFIHPNMVPNDTLISFAKFHPKRIKDLIEVVRARQPAKTDSDRPE